MGRPATILLLLLMMAGASCTLWRGLFGELKQPQATLESLTVKKAGFLAIELEAGIRVTNPNDFELALKSLDYELSSGDRPVGRGSWQKTFVVGPGGTGTLHLPLTLQTREALRLVQQYLKDPDGMSGTVSGRAVFLTEMGEIGMDFHEEKPFRRASGS